MVSASEGQQWARRAPDDGAGRLVWARVALIALVVAAVVAVRAPDAGEIGAMRMLALTGASALIIWLPGMALICATNTSDELDACVKLTLGSAIVGSILFVVWFFSPVIGAIVGLLALVASVRLILERPEALTALTAPMILMSSAVILYIAMGADHSGMKAAIHTIALRYWPSVDNALPMLLLDNLMKGREHLMPFVDAGTHTSDRPPLQAGMMLLGYPYAAPDVRIAVALALGVAANALWVPAFWAFLRALDVDKRAAGFVVIIVMVTGSVFFSTIYTWPKMLAAAFCLLVAALVMRGAMRWGGRPVVVGLCAGMAALAHSGIAFGLIGLAPLLLLFRGRWDWRGSVLAVAVAGACYAPWVAYQRFVDPPGDRMPKWHLAGVIEPVEESFTTVFKRQYAEAGVIGALENKWRNVLVFTGIVPWRPVPEWGWRDTELGRLRDATIRAFLLSALFTPLGLLLAWGSPYRRAIMAIGAIAAATTAVFLLLEFGDKSLQSAAWLHHGPYSLLILWAAIGALAVAHRPMVARAFLVAQIAAFVILWIVDGQTPQWRHMVLAPWSPVMVAVEVCMLLALLLVGAYWTRRRALSESAS